MRRIIALSPCILLGVSAGSPYSATCRAAVETCITRDERIGNYRDLSNLQGNGLFGPACYAWEHCKDAGLDPSSGCEGGVADSRDILTEGLRRMQDNMGLARGDFSRSGDPAACNELWPMLR